jgi:hypothetical protein
MNIVHLIKNSIFISMMVALLIYVQAANAASHFFGLHAVGPYLELAKAAGASSARYIASWDKFEPTNGQYDFQLADKIVKLAQRENIDLVMTLQCDSKWACKVGVHNQASVPTTKASMPLKMQYWRDLLSKVVERYDGDGLNDMPGLLKPVKYWQIQNEWQVEWQGTNYEFRQIMQTAYSVIKQTDPEAKVISPGLTGTRLFALCEGLNDRGWIYWGMTDGQIRQIGKASQLIALPFLEKHPQTYNRAKDLFASCNQYFDIIDVHLYTCDPYECAYDLKWIKKQMQISKFNKPIWSLEFACPFYNFSSENFARCIVEAQTIGFYNGLERIYWSSLVPTLGWSENFLRLSLALSSGIPKKELAIYSAMAKSINGFEKITRIKTANDSKAWLFKFNNRKKIVWIGWTEDGTLQVNIDNKKTSNVILRKDPIIVSSE